MLDRSRFTPQLAAVGLLALWVALPAAADEKAWRGAAGLQVVVHDEAGLPVPDVIVDLRFEDQPIGPAPQRTDAEGRTEFSGLAPGEWQVDLRREGFMLVTSFLRIDLGKRPQVGFTSRQRTGSYWAQMDVGYSRPGAAVAVASSGSSRDIERAQKRAEKQLARREKRLAKSNVARVVAAPPPPPQVAESAPGANPLSEEPAETEAEAPQPAEPTLAASEVAQPVDTDVEMASATSPDVASEPTPTTDPVVPARADVAEPPPVIEASPEAAATEVELAEFERPPASSDPPSAETVPSPPQPEPERQAETVVEAFPEVTEAEEAPVTEEVVVETPDVTDTDVPQTTDEAPQVAAVPAESNERAESDRPTAEERRERRAQARAEREAEERAQRAAEEETQRASQVASRRSEPERSKKSRRSSRRGRNVARTVAEPWRPPQTSSTPAAVEPAAEPAVEPTAVAEQPVESTPAPRGVTTPEVVDEPPESPVVADNAPAPERIQRNVTPPSDPPVVRDQEPVPDRLLRNPNLLPAGACPECRDGEWSVAATWPAEPRGVSDRACSSGVPDLLRRVLARIDEVLDEKFHGYTGALIAPDGNDVLRLLPESVRTELQSILLPVIDPVARCQAIGLLLPQRARYVGFQYEAADENAPGLCVPGQDCQVGNASWVGEPRILRGRHLTLVYATFENRSQRLRREARLTVYFKPARGWLPPN